MDNYNPGQHYPVQGHIQQDEARGMAVASMVLGIIGLVFSCCFFVSIPVAVTGLILGIVSLAKKKGGKGMAVAGVVMCGLSLFLGIMIVVGLALFTAETGSSWSELWPEFWEEFNSEYNL